MKSSRKGVKICCEVTATFFIIVAVVFVTLWFTTLKPKEPEITTYLVGLENMNPFLLLTINNVRLNMTITIDNHRNIGSFKFSNATAYVKYHGDVVAEVPIGQNLVPARGKLNITSSTDLMVGRMVANPIFFDDVGKGSLNLTATAALHGKVSLLFEFVKLRATTFSTCDISFLVASMNVKSMCMSKIKL